MKYNRVPAQQLLREQSISYSSFLLSGFAVPVIVFWIPCFSYSILVWSRMSFSWFWFLHIYSYSFFYSGTGVEKACFHPGSDEQVVIMGTLLSWFDRECNYPDHSLQGELIRLLFISLSHLIVLFHVSWSSLRPLHLTFIISIIIITSALSPHRSCSINLIY